MELDWRPIETANTDCMDDVMLWNGERVFPGWYNAGSGWHDSRNQDRDDRPAEPQPTKWTPFPDPPRP